MPARAAAGRPRRTVCRPCRRRPELCRLGTAMVRQRHGSARERSARGPLFERSFLVALARAFAGAIIFALPLLMTMEMWALGFYMHPLRLALFLALMFPLLVVLAYYAGFEESVSWQHLVLSACVAYAVAFVAAGRRPGAARRAAARHVDRGDRRQDLAAGDSGEHRRHAGAQPARPARRGAGGRGAARTPISASCSWPPSAPCSWRSTSRRPRRWC